MISAILKREKWCSVGKRGLELSKCLVDVGLWNVSVCEQGGEHYIPWKFTGNALHWWHDEDCGKELPGSYPEACNRWGTDNKTQRHKYTHTQTLYGGQDGRGQRFYENHPWGGSLFLQTRRYENFIDRLGAVTQRCVDLSSTVVMFWVPRHPRHKQKLSTPVVYQPLPVEAESASQTLIES